MQPHLTRRGKFVACTSSSFVAVGALHAALPLLVAGGVALVALFSAYLTFFPAAILLRHRQLELSWWISTNGPAHALRLVAEVPFVLNLVFRNHSPRRFHLLETQVFATSGIRLDSAAASPLPAERASETTVQGVASRSGYHVLHGIVLRFVDTFGLFTLEGYFPSPIAVRVFPPSLHVDRPRHNTGLGTKHGQYLARTRGLEGDLRELRDYSSGDPYKHIAWKASSRRRKLMVREFESERVSSHAFLLDVGSTMRTGSTSGLELGIRAIAAATTRLIRNGDQVSVVCYDHSVFSYVPLGSDRHQEQRVLSALLDAQSVVHKDFTDTTTTELVAIVARYLAHQEARDFRLLATPPMNDPSWERVAPGPQGELYDFESLQDFVTKLNEIAQRKTRTGVAPTHWFRDPAFDRHRPDEQLRLFCRLRGIELPYLAHANVHRRAAGFAAAMAQANSPSMVDNLVVISDFEWLTETSPWTELTRRAIQTRRRPMQCWVPFLQEDPLEHATQKTVLSATFDRSQRLRFATARRQLQRSGLAVSPLLRASSTSSPPR